MRFATHEIVHGRFQSDRNGLHPLVTDSTLSSTVLMNDNAPQLNAALHLQVSVPLSVLDRKQGKILRASAGVIRGENARETLNKGLLRERADVVARDEVFRTEAISDRTSLLPDQVRPYRGIDLRSREDLQSINLGETVFARQTATGLTISSLHVLNQPRRVAVEG